MGLRQPHHEPASACKAELAWQETALRVARMGSGNIAREDVGCAGDGWRSSLCGGPSLCAFRMASQTILEQARVQRSSSCPRPHRVHCWVGPTDGQEVLVCSAWPLLLGTIRNQRQEKRAQPAGTDGQDRPPSDVMWGPMPREQRGAH